MVFNKRFFIIITLGFALFVACSDYNDRDEIVSDLNLLYLAHQKGDADTIEKISKKILKSKKTIGSPRIPALIFLAELEAKQGHLKAVKDLFDSQFQYVVKSTGSCSFAAFMTMRGDVWRDTGYYQQAVEDYQLAIEKCPKIDNAHSKLSLLYSSDVDQTYFKPDEALTLAKEAIYIGKKSTSYNALAAAHAALGQYDLAVQHAMSAIASAQKERRSKEAIDRYRDALAVYAAKLKP